MNSQVEPLTKDNSDRRTLQALFLVGLFLLIVCYAPWLFCGREFVLGDCQYTYQPICDFVRRCLLSGIMPFWNPRDYCGLSELAVTSPSIFYPFNYILFLLPFSCAMAIYLVLHQFLSGCAVYFYCNLYFKDWRPSVFAGLCTMFCGYFFAVQKYPDFAASVAAFLFCLCGTIVTFRYQNAVCFILLSIFFCLLLSSGRPEIVAPAILLIAIQVVWEAFRTYLQSARLKTTMIGIFLTGVSLCLGFALAAPSLFPGYEWLKISPRSLGLAAAEVFQWSAGWYDLCSIFFWYPFGDLEMQRFDDGTAHGLLKTPAGISIPFLSPCYVGPGILVCFLAGMISKSFHWRLRLALAAICLAALIVALGENTPVAPLLLKYFSKLAVVRYPVKLLVFFLLPVIFVASKGFIAILKIEARMDSLLKVCFGVFLLLAFFGLLFYTGGGFANFLAWLCQLNSVTLREVEFDRLLNDVFISFLVTAISGGLFCVAGFSKLFIEKPFLRYCSLLLLVILPMVSFGVSCQERSAPSGYYDKPPELAGVMDQVLPKKGQPLSRLSYLIYEPLKASSEYLNDQQLPYAIAASKFGRDVLLPNTHYASRWNTSNGYALTETAMMSDIYESAISACSVINNEPNDLPLARICSITNSEYAVTAIQRLNGTTVPPLASDFFEPIAENIRLNLRIFKLRNCGSRFYFASKVEEVGDWNVLVKMAKSKERRGDEIKFLGDKYTFLPKSGFSALRDELKRSQVKCEFEPSIELVADLPGRTELISKNRNVSVLVLRDSIYPGWKVFVDGKPSEIFRANLLNRALILPAGLHKVVFQYQPESLRDALLVSAFALLCLLSSPFFIRRIRSPEISNLR